MQLSKKTQRQASIAAISGLVIIGAASLFFKTYPHLNPFSRKVTKKDEEKSDEKSETESEAVEEALEIPISAETEEFSPVDAADAN